MTRLFINDWRSYNEGEWITDEWMTPSQILEFLDEHEEEGYPSHGNNYELSELYACAAIVSGVSFYDLTEDVDNGKQRN